VGELVEVSLLAAAMAVQLQDLVWLSGEADESEIRPVDRAHLDARAAEIAGGVAMNPYYRCFEAADGFLAVACLNLAQRRAFLAAFGLEDDTVEAPDLVPDDPALLAAKEAVVAEIERAIAGRPTSEWLERLESAGVPCGVVQTRESVYADPQVAAAGLVGDVVQPGLGNVRLLAPFIRVGDEARAVEAAPELGADTEAVLGSLG
jgi:crotonobetainyl-CoA:carnitine CoA-transferase CaiB-like acyl-CoA transferase